MKKSTAILGTALTLSLATNAYLFKLIVDWQDAWLEQILTTSDVELLYRNSGAETSFEAMKGLAREHFGDYRVISPAESENFGLKSDEPAIFIDGTVLYFEDGHHIGSKADLPEGLTHWRIGQDEL